MNNHRFTYQTQFDFKRIYTVGQGQILIIDGWAYHPEYSIQRLEVILGDVVYPVQNSREPRPDILYSQIVVDALANSLFSGFRAFIPIQPIKKPEARCLTLRANFLDGTHIDQVLGEVKLTPLPEAVEQPVSCWVSDAPRVAICMATYRPDPDAFRRQIESLKAQTHTNWICIINDDHTPPSIFGEMEKTIGDDPRFFVYRSIERLGFYYNFEQALSRVPESAEFVALSDQDDDWYPEKLSSCLAAFTAQTQLVYSDMRIVATDGRVIANTYWTTRRNNYTDFPSLLLANTVTGAASVFRAALLGGILPFPERLGESFHDHWIACVAMAHGRLGYVDHPLYDYRQHGANVLGHYTPEPHRPRLLHMAKRVRQGVRNPAHFRTSMRGELEFDREIFRADVQRIGLIARTLQLRCHGISIERLRVIDQFARIDRSLGFLLVQALHCELDHRPTLGAEWYCLRGFIGYQLYRRYYQLTRERQRRYATALGTQAALSPIRSGNSSMTSFPALQVIEEKIAPIKLTVRQSEPRRINMIIPTIDFKVLFGGYLGKLNLALKLQQVGYRIRLVLVDHTQVDVERWRVELQKFPGLESLLDRVEIAYHFDRSLPLEVSPSDRFIATTWWTAHIAHSAAQEMGSSHFVYLIQEYEPMTFPMGSFYALADETYTFPHRAVFSTELLRDYFRQQKLGVFTTSIETGDARSVAFQNAINRFSVTREMLEHTGSKKLLFYARPEQHAARNLFELAVLSLNRALDQGVFSDQKWEFRGIGSLSQNNLVLSKGIELKLLPRTGLDEYLDLLPTFDLGLSLMLTPHPSLVPLEMASAGLWTVTNTYANKTALSLQSLSSNLIPVPPTISGVVTGLRRAVECIDNTDARLAGANVQWATTWDAAFNASVMDKINLFLNGENC